MPRGLRAGSFATRLLRACAWFVQAMPRPDCNCTGGRGYRRHASTCLRWAHTRLVAILEANGYALETAELEDTLTTLEELERGGTQGGAEANWKGAGMDPVARAWLRREIIKAKNERQGAREELEDLERRLQLPGSPWARDVGPLGKRRPTKQYRLEHAKRKKRITDATARIRALRDVDKAFRHYVERGAQIVDMTQQAAG